MTYELACLFGVAHQPSLLRSYGWASHDFRGDAERRLADINRVATSELWL